MQRNFPGAIDGRVMSRRRTRKFPRVQGNVHADNKTQLLGCARLDTDGGPGDLALWGNTPCLEVQAPDGTQFILDCGTGLRMLGNRWVGPHGTKAAEAHIFVTHYHWDHIQGIPFFAPLYAESNRFHFYSFRSRFLGPDSLKQVFETQMAHPYFPVDISAMSAARKFSEMSDGEQSEISATKVTARWLNHPQ